MMIKNTLVAFAVITSLGGCAITSMDAKIRPDTQVAESHVGNGARVGVTVVDERPEQDIGKRAPMGAKIKLKEDLASIYQSALISGLEREGFQPVAGNIDGANLKVEIRALSYEVSTGWWTGGITIDSAIKAYVSGGSEPYERLYRASDEDRAYYVPGAHASNDKLNAAVSSTLRQLLDDQKLLEVIATPGAGKH